mgnify:CR=1 FL=1
MHASSHTETASKFRLFFWSLTAALAGFLFGFDAVVISGAEQKIQAIWSLSDGMHGLVMSMALWGTVLGSLLGGFPAERFGRRQTLIYIGLLYFVSAVWSGLAAGPYGFMVARFIGGLGVGISTVAAPMFISEIAPAKDRGRLAGMFQFNIVFGILVAFVSNSLISGTSPNDWRWMLGIEALPALLYTILCFRIPESPRWLIFHAGRLEEGAAVYRCVHPDLSEEQIQEKVRQIARDPDQEHVRHRFWSRRLRKPILLAFLVAFFNQLSGINAILFFAPRIFEMTGLGTEAALLQSIGIGLTNLVFTFVGLYLIDRLGRRTLLYIGSFGYIISLGLCAWAFKAEVYGIVPACIFAFIAAHAVGQGTVIWVLIGEIFPNRNRSAGQSLGSFTHWIFAASLTLVFPKMAASFHPSSIFAFFCFMMVLQLLWVKFMVPETKGRTLEEIEQDL